MYTIRIHPYLIYIVKQDIHIAGQTAGQIGLGGVIGLKIEICFQFFFHGQRRALQLVKIMKY